MIKTLPLIMDYSLAMIAFVALVYLGTFICRAIGSYMSGDDLSDEPYTISRIFLDLYCPLYGVFEVEEISYSKRTGLYYLDTKAGNVSVSIFKVLLVLMLVYALIVGALHNGWYMMFLFILTGLRITRSMKYHSNKGGVNGSKDI